MIRELRTRLEVRAFLGMILFGMSLSSCQFWGEDAPQTPPLADLADSTSCADPMEIIEAEQTRAIATLDCWVRRVESALGQIQGEDPGRISDDELWILFESRVIPVQGSPRDLYQKILAVKRLIGLPNYIERAGLYRWIKWVKSNQPGLKAAYTTVNKFTYGEFISKTDLNNTVEVITKFLIEADWSFEPRKIADSISRFLPAFDSDNHTKTIVAHLAETLDLASKSLESVCPAYRYGLKLKSKHLGQCLNKLQVQITPAQSWVEFMINSPSVNQDYNEILFSINQTEPIAFTWFKQPGLKAFPIGEWINLLQKSGYEIPAEFSSALVWLERISPGSNSQEIEAVALQFFLRALARSHRTWVEGLKIFAVDPVCRSNYEDNCKIDINESRYIDSKIIPVDFGLNPGKISRAKLKQLSYFYAASWSAMELFDTNHDGMVSTNSDNNTGESNEVFALVATVIQIMKILEGEDAIVFDSYDISGLATLITDVGSEILLNLDENEKGTRKLIQDGLEQLYGENVLFLDRLSLTAVFSMFDSLSDYRAAMIVEIIRSNGEVIVSNSNPSETLINRSQFIENLANFLRPVFPRLVASCEKQGFAASCGIALDEILASELPGTRFIGATDLDALIFTAIGFESLMSTCDSERDHGLKWTAKSSNDDDELFCAFKKARKVALRLMDSNIIEEDSEVRGTLDFLVGNSLGRNGVKVSMIKGSQKGVLIVNPSNWKGKSASLGSLMSLFSEVLRPSQ